MLIRPFEKIPRLIPAFIREFRHYTIVNKFEKPEVESGARDPFLMHRWRFELSSQPTHKGDLNIVYVIAEDQRERGPSLFRSDTSSRNERRNQWNISALETSKSLFVPLSLNLAFRRDPGLFLIGRKPFPSSLFAMTLSCSGWFLPHWSRVEWTSHKPRFMPTII